MSRNHVHKKFLIIAVLGSLALAGTVWCATRIWDSSNFTMEERKWQAPPEGLTPGADNGTGDGSHHPTDDCGICHASNGIAASKILTISATIYDSRAARRPLPGAEIVFQDFGGNYYSMTANDLGIMWSEQPMYGDTRMSDPDDPDDSNTWRYKTWVKAGDGVRPMMTMPSVGGMMAPRMSCNMHHVLSGTLGGLWAMPAGTLRSYPEKNLSYQKHIFPILRTKCGPCHIPGPSTASQRGGEEIFEYSSNLDLMTYAGSSVAVGSTVYEKLGIESIVNTSNPDASLLFAKTVYGSIHGGGSFWNTGDPDYGALRRWIAEGAREN